MSAHRATYLVTGGAGFIGRALVAALASEGARVRVLDDRSRAAVSAEPARPEIEVVTGDVRDLDTVRRAVRGVDRVCHLAAINGTEYFYSMPDRVLEVAVKGMLNVLDACIEQGVGDLCVASSSEVYQTPPSVPTAEDVPLSVPDPLNPRYSYGGGKIASELLALHYGARLRRVTVVRPHNVYGPNMGKEHVVPQLILKLRERIARQPSGTIDLPVQGTGSETRAFTFIDDAVEGIMRVLEHGTHRNIYHVGADVETPIAELAHTIAGCFSRTIRIVPSPAPAGGTLRRCPDIGKLRALGFVPRVPLAEGIARTVAWYRSAPA